MSYICIDFDLLWIPFDPRVVVVCSTRLSRTQHLSVVRTENSAAQPVKNEALYGLSQEHITEGLGQQWSKPFQTIFITPVLELIGMEGSIDPEKVSIKVWSSHVAFAQL
jgi:hypothetical protein